MPLAVQVANPGSRGQDSRYKFDPTFMYVGPDGRITDGVWHYSGDENAMLSDDRPSIAIPGPPPADDSDGMYRYSASVPRGAYHPGTGTPEKAAAPQREFVPMPRLKKGESIPEGHQFWDISPPTWSDPNYGEQNKQQYRSMLDGLFNIIQKNNPGLFKDRAAYNVNVDAIMAGNPILSKPYAPAFAKPASPTAQPGNPYGTLGPSPQRVQAVKAQNPYGGLGPSPQRVANVQAAAKRGPTLKPAPVPVRPPPTPPKVILPKPTVKKPTPKRSGA